MGTVWAIRDSEITKPKRHRITKRIKKIEALFFIRKE
jgi:hypothetical protein